jgi:desulfoferrodoxin-like iron-binding protein
MHPDGGSERGRAGGHGTPQAIPGGRKELILSVKRVGEKYQCGTCGNEVEVTRVGGGSLVCCGQPMQLQG